MFKLKSIIFADFLRYFSVTKMLTEIQNILKKIQKKIQRLGKVCLKDVFFLCFEEKNKTKKQKYVCIDIQLISLSRSKFTLTFLNALDRDKRMKHLHTLS